MQNYFFILISRFEVRTSRFGRSLASHRYRKSHLPDRRVVVRIAAELVPGAIPLNDVLDLAIDILQIVVVDMAGQEDIAHAARRDVNALVAPYVAQNGIVVDEQIEIEAIKAQRNRVRVIDADREVEVHRRRKSEIDTRPYLSE